MTLGVADGDVIDFLALAVNSATLIDTVGDELAVQGVIGVVGVRVLC
ncbi:hypothetical protein ACO0LF_31655 [Undibacterium sp. Di27W]